MNASTFISKLFEPDNLPTMHLSLFIGGTILLILFVFLIYYVVFRVKHEPPEQIDRTPDGSPYQDLSMSYSGQNPEPVQIIDRCIREQAKLQKLIGLLKTAKRRESLYPQEAILEDLEGVVSKVRDKIGSDQTSFFPQYASYHADTAIELLENYLELDQNFDESVENINKIRNEIIESFPWLLIYYQDFLNRLYDAQYFDVASDVAVVKSISEDNQNVLRRCNHVD